MIDYIRDGQAIYRQSFATIRAEANLAGIPADLEKLAVRVIHACGMVDVVDDLRFSPGAGAGREAQVVDHVDHAAGVDHPDRELFQVGRDAGEVRFGADGGERLAIDRLAIADVVNHAGFPEVGWEGRAAR